MRRRTFSPSDAREPPAPTLERPGMRRVPVNRVGRRSGALHDRDDPRRPLRRRPNGARPPLGRTSRPSGLRPTTGSNPSSDDVVLRREHGTSPQGHGEGWAPPTSRDGSRSAPLGSRGRLEPPGFRGRRRRVLGRPHSRPPRCQRRPKVDPPSTRRRHRAHVAPQPRRGSSVAEPRTHGLTKRPVVSRSN